MPRASDGSYSLPSGTLVNTGDTILTSQHNPFAQDVAQALSNSLDRNGSGGMRASLGMGGNRVANMADGVNPGDAVTVRQLESASSVPIGAVIDYWGSNPPTGYMFAAGQELSRAEYATLFASIGTNAGAGNGSTTFNVPDYRGRVGAGRDNMGGTGAGRITAASGITGTSLGGNGGQETVTLNESQMPSHNHAITDPGHRHAVATVGTGAGLPESGGNLSASSGNTQSSTTGITIASAGGGQAHGNVQPTIVCNKIIRYA